ncbi:hypothetical protein [Chryseobacterium sp. Leaf394]|uniref:hypothetical protein n=1 Tax=Chryseobacterium sp. Leaf394 TaxID=1736361 RepID=UPI0006F9BA85|nr:hypothetical protein [Chryseobacterium sp. Leaf394]KQS93008.1 hypothetical protein ASG21_11415 [Chryseobacterium sp. Leaf394]
MNTEENNNNNLSDRGSSFWETMVSFWHKNRDFGQPESVWKKKADLVNGTVPSSQLPSYVDDVIEVDLFQSLPSSGEKGKIYIITTDNTQYRWSGSGYIQINSLEFTMDLRTNQDVNGKKTFITKGGNRYTNNNLWIGSRDGYDPSITFIKSNNASQLSYDGKTFLFRNADGSEAASLTAESVVAKNRFLGSVLTSPVMDGGLVFNAANQSQLYIGNPSVNDVIIESGNNSLYHHRAGFGKGRIWDEHILPQTAIDNWNNKFGDLKRTDDLDSISKSGIYRQETPNSGFHYTTTLNMNSADGRQQLSIGRHGEGMKFRGSDRGSGNGGWEAWKTIWHDGNLNPATQNDLSYKLSKSGDTMTGSINFANNSGGIKGVIGDNDYWRVYGNSTGSNQGYLEIATGDDGNEPIYARQYSGEFNSIVRTATILDENGNTHFPKNITAESSINAGSDSRISGRIFGKVELIDATGLSQDTYYPVPIKLQTSYASKIKVYRNLDGSMGVPLYSTHHGGFWCYYEFEDYGNGWGGTDNFTVCNFQQQSWSYGFAIGYSKIGESSESIVWVRGGSKYWFDVNENTPLVLYPNGYTSPYGQTVNPTTVRPWVDINKNTTSKDLINYWKKSDLEDYKQYGLGTNLPQIGNVNSQRSTGMYYLGFNSLGTLPYEYASVLHFKYTDNEYAQLAIQHGGDNLAFRRNNSSWMQVWHNGNFNPDLKVNNIENAAGIGFTSGNSNEAPYFYHSTDGYRFLATQTWSSDNFITKAHPVNAIAQTDIDNWNNNNVENLVSDIIYEIGSASDYILKSESLFYNVTLKGDHSIGLNFSNLRPKETLTFRNLRSESYGVKINGGSHYSIGGNSVVAFYMNENAEIIITRPGGEVVLYM